MARYFAVQPTSTDASRTFADADRIAAHMHPVAKALNVRFVAVRPRMAYGFVYAVTSRRPIVQDDVTARLRKEPELEHYRISMEADSPDGPFAWR